MRCDQANGSELKKKEKNNTSVFIFIVYLNFRAFSDALNNKIQRNTKNTIIGSINISKFRLILLDHITNIVATFNETIWTHFKQTPSQITHTCYSIHYLYLVHSSHITIVLW